MEMLRQARRQSSVKQPRKERKEEIGTHLEALPPPIWRRVRDPVGSRHESSIENQNIPSAYSSSSILQHLLVRNTDVVDGAARTVWRQMVLRFCESGFVAAEEDECFAPALAKAEAVSRPMPLPFRWCQ